MLKQLVDPLRLRVIDRLSHAGPATVSRLAAELEVPMPQLSNHLRRLRDAGLVSAQRTGRQVVYALADPGLELLTPLLDSITGRVQAASSDHTTGGIASRTCYGHLGGEIGVRIYRALLEHDALRARPDGIVDLGPEAATILARLGVDPAVVPGGRQRFAFECLDATQRLPHLAGALGDAIARALTERGWIAHVQGSRVFTLTPVGRRELKRALAVSVAPVRRTR